MTPGMRGTATGGGRSFERPEDFSRFAAALSFRFPVHEGLIVFELLPSNSAKDDIVVAYLREMTGQYFSRPDVITRWNRFIARGDARMIKHAVEARLRRWAVEQRFCRTLKGRLGFVPADARGGDKICVIRGHGAPYVLREKEDGGYQAVWECFFDDVMNMSLEEDAWRQTDETFVLA